MPNKSLTQYLRENLAKGIIDFSIRAEIHARSRDVRFYIHPSAVSGDTADFVATEDPFNPDYDFLFNLAGSMTDAEVEENAKRLVAELRARRGANDGGEPCEPLSPPVGTPPNHP
jgi:hypothetical protein